MISNIFAGLQPDVHAGVGETFDTLLARPGLKIERIVSTGQCSPAGFWYDQPDDEWVIVLQGVAGLLLEGEAAVRRLGPGDFLQLPAHRRHRVEWTDEHTPTVWLAVHFRPGEADADDDAISV